MGKRFFPITLSLIHSIMTAYGRRYYHIKCINLLHPNIQFSRLHSLLLIALSWFSQSYSHYYCHRCKKPFS